MNPNIVNLTKQMIIIHDNRRADNDRVVAVVPPGKKELSVGVIYRRMQAYPQQDVSEGDIPIFVQHYRMSDRLPSKQKGTIYIVSREVAEIVRRGRNDIYSTGEVIWSMGNKLACNGLVWGGSY